MGVAVYRRWQLKSLRRKIERLFHARQSGTVNDTALHKEIALYYQLGALYDKLRFNKHFPFATERALESYRAAVALEDTQAKYIVGKRLLDKGVFWDEIKKTLFACKVHERYARDSYDEAFVYLQSASQAGHFAAKRLLGLAQIKGWGVPIDRNKGLQLIVESIEQEGAWDNAEKIAADLGLNKADFFASIVSLKGKSSK